MSISLLLPPSLSPLRRTQGNPQFPSVSRHRNHYPTVTTVPSDSPPRRYPGAASAAFVALAYYIRLFVNLASFPASSMLPSPVLRDVRLHLPLLMRRRSCAIPVPPSEPPQEKRSSTVG